MNAARWGRERERRRQLAEAWQSRIDRFDIIIRDRVTGEEASATYSDDIGRRIRVLIEEAALP